MLRSRATLLALPWLLAGAFAFPGDDAAPPAVTARGAAALQADFDRLEGAWSAAWNDWLAAVDAEETGDPGPEVQPPDVEFSRRFEELAAAGCGPAALWRLEHYRSALALGSEDELPAEARAGLLAVYDRLLGQHADDVELLVPSFFDRLAIEKDLTDFEVDGICALLEMAGRHPEVQAHSILVRAARTAPLGSESALDQALAGFLLDRVQTEFFETSAYVEAVEARWRLDHLSVGRKPPTFETQDLAGNEIVLSDLAGRVRVVAFLGDEPGSSEAGIARAGELQSRYWDDRFTWIGIHEHPDSSAVELLLQEPDVLGTHAFEGAGARPAVEAWRVHRRPLTFLLDGHGCVRGVDLQGEALHERIGELLEELDELDEADAPEDDSGPSDPSPGDQSLSPPQASESE